MGQLVRVSGKSTQDWQEAQLVEATHRPKVEEDEGGSPFQEHIAWVRVRMEKTVIKDLSEHLVERPAREGSTLRGIEFR
jgi:predicted phosphohydrolase